MTAGRLRRTFTCGRRSTRPGAVRNRSPSPTGLVSTASRRRGTVLAIVLLLLAVISLLTAALVQGSLLGIRRQKLAERTAQADALLQAGRDRAVSLWRGGEPATAFPGGTALWEIPPAEVPGGALVELRLFKPAGGDTAEGEMPRVDVQVTYPREGPTAIHREGRFSLPVRTVTPPVAPAEPAAGDSESN